MQNKITGEQVTFLENHSYYEMISLLRIMYILNEVGEENRDSITKILTKQGELPI